MPLSRSGTACAGSTPRASSRPGCRGAPGTAPPGPLPPPRRRRRSPPACARLLERVLHGYLAVAEVLVVHALDRQVGRLERVEADEAESLGRVRHVVPHDLRRLYDRPERAERVVQELLVDVGRVQVPDEKVRAHVEAVLPALLVEARLVHPHRPAEELDHPHDLYGVVGVGDVEELDEAVPPVQAGELVLRHVDRVDPPDLREELDEKVLGHARVEVADVAGRLLVAVLDVREGRLRCDVRMVSI
ncbi:hypothetical protein THAOC_18369 [Thalassiosira oceanica]|uniref:Uncharacterized protein n=1 Tax=Thalassiosira oceanica TaxID=159749 RepID=K0S586_THAOC|nr:hypothetical protein THAOC_18369 [Thalassiosira oceanica]|eukprot:EJK61188.1 hypothetical protein THAOC_18369 [Thalassiosira oceanica]